MPYNTPGYILHSSNVENPSSQIALRTPAAFALPSVWSPQTRYGADSGKNAAARPPALIRSTPRQHYLVGHPSVHRPLEMTLMKRLAFQQVAGDLVMRQPHMQEYLFGEKCCMDCCKEESLSGSRSMEA